MYVCVCVLEHGTIVRMINNFCLDIRQDFFFIDPQRACVFQQNFNCFILCVVIISYMGYDMFAYSGNGVLLE
jgi:hypothetical protein